ncbi:hypothetical protein CTI14_66520, partial [Methylobacterium radiotolerans]
TATIPLTFGLIFGAVTSGQIASRFGKYKPLMLFGLMVMILGFWWASAPRRPATATIPLTFGLIFGAVTSGQIASRFGKYKPLML